MPRAGGGWAILLRRVGGNHMLMLVAPFAPEPAGYAVFQLLIFVDAVRRGEYPGQPGDWSV